MLEIRYAPAPQGYKLNGYLFVAKAGHSQISAKELERRMNPGDDE
jgi:hypothetical protein